MRSAWLLAAFLGMSVVPAQAEVAVQTKGAVQVVGKVALGPRQKRAFSELKSRSSDFYGAYFVATGSDDGSFWVDEHHLEDAKTYAKAACLELSGGAPCVLYATIVPAGAKVGKGRAVVGINHSLSKHLANMWPRAKPGTYVAVAANRMAQWGSSWGYDTQAEARKLALQNCISGTERDVFRDQVSAQVFNQALAQGKFDCKIVAEWQR